MVDSQNRPAFCPLPWMRPLQEAQRIYLQAKRAGKSSHFFPSPTFPETPRLVESYPGRPKLQHCLNAVSAGWVPCGAICHPHHWESAQDSSLLSPSLPGPSRGPAHSRYSLSVCSPELKYLSQQIGGPSASPGAGREGYRVAQSGRSVLQGLVLGNT